MTAIIPKSYDEWRHCITVECGLTLSKAYIEQRINALNSVKDEHTRQFISKYGQAYTDQVIRWFEQARAVHQ